MRNKAATLFRLYRAVFGYGTHARRTHLYRQQSKQFSSRRWFGVFFSFFFFSPFISIYFQTTRPGVNGRKILFDPVKFIRISCVYMYTRSLEHQRKIQWPRVFLLTYQCWCLKTFKYYVVMNSTEKREYSPYTFTLHFTIVIDLIPRTLEKNWTRLNGFKTV